MGNRYTTQWLWGFTQHRNIFYFAIIWVTLILRRLIFFAWNFIYLNRCFFKSKRFCPEKPTDWFSMVQKNIFTRGWGLKSRLQHFVFYRNVCIRVCTGKIQIFWIDVNTDADWWMITYNYLRRIQRIIVWFTFD